MREIRRTQHWRKFLFSGIFTKQPSPFVHREQWLLPYFHDIPYLALLLKLVCVFWLWLKLDKNIKLFTTFHQTFLWHKTLCSQQYFSCVNGSPSLVLCVLIILSGKEMNTTLFPELMFQINNNSEINWNWNWILAYTINHETEVWQNHHDITSTYQIIYTSPTSLQIYQISGMQRNPQTFITKKMDCTHYNKWWYL